MNADLGALATALATALDVVIDDRLTERCLLETFWPLALDGARSVTKVTPRHC